MKTVHYVLNYLAYLGPKIWEMLPNNLERLESAEGFKSKIKKLDTWKLPMQNL